MVEAGVVDAVDDAEPSDEEIPLIPVLIACSAPKKTLTPVYTT